MIPCQDVLGVPELLGGGGEAESVLGSGGGGGGAGSSPWDRAQGEAPCGWPSPRCPSRDSGCFPPQPGSPEESPTRTHAVLIHLSHNSRPGAGAGEVEFTGSCYSRLLCPNAVLGILSAWVLGALALGGGRAGAVSPKAVNK